MAAAEDLEELRTPVRTPRAQPIGVGARLARAAVTLERIETQQQGDSDEEDREEPEEVDPAQAPVAALTQVTGGQGPCTGQCTETSVKNGCH
jgi:hypothetical protein